MIFALNCRNIKSAEAVISTGVNSAIFKEFLTKLMNILEREGQFKIVVDNVRFHYSDPDFYDTWWNIRIEFSILLITVFETMLSESEDKIIQISLFESSQKFGGWIDSTLFDDNHIAGRRFDFGPKSIRAKNPKIAPFIYMLNETELIDKVVKTLENDPISRNRYIYLKGELIPLSLKNIITGRFSNYPPHLKSLGFKAAELRGTDMNVNNFGSFSHKGPRDIVFATLFTLPEPNIGGLFKNGRAMQRAVGRRINPNNSKT
ncbi:hypothetical protein RF11_05484 [Thelohanellus kitauei]|uniref:Uncharacterized protein n=1 Tax=Thelohanellus kitauei TaxID=669202 RepID=A0A0C2IHB8_THEKT|nr:hypothetical protein RF11_05484 [Thelohanellus kitauei]